MFKHLFGLFVALFSLSGVNAQGACTEYRISSSTTLDSGWQTSADAAAAAYAFKLSTPGSCTVGGPYISTIVFAAVAYQPPSYTYTRTAKTWNSSCTTQTSGNPSSGAWPVQTRAAECATPPPPTYTCPSQNSDFFDGLEWQFEVPAGSTMSDLDQCAPNAPGSSSGPGCTIEYNGTISVNAGKTMFSGVSSSTSAPCEYAPNPTGTQTPMASYPPPPPEMAKAPPAGTCPGYVNGQLVFLPCSFGPSTETIAVTGTRANGTDTITDSYTGSTVCNQSTCDFSVTSTSTSASGGSTAATQEGSVTDSTTEGTGTTPDPCGAPGQPVCAVKVDESGTKSVGNYAGADTKLTSGADAVTKAFQDVTSVTTLDGSWSFAFPTGSCAPMALGWSIWRFTLDLCSFPNIDLFRAFWSWAFGVMGALYIWRSVSGAVG